MAAIETWAKLAASNDQAPPSGAPERHDRDKVNDIFRENMSSLRTFFEDGEWLDLTKENKADFSVSLAGALAFTVTDIGGTDATSKFPVGRWVRITGTSTADPPGPVVLAEIDSLAAYTGSAVTVTVKNPFRESTFISQATIPDLTVTKVECYWNSRVREAAFHPVGTTIAQNPKELLQIDDLGSADAITQINTGTGLDSDLLEGLPASTFALAGERGTNYVMNTGMSVWQRGFSLTTGLVDEDFTADGWILLEEGNTFEVSRETTEVPFPYRYALKLTGTGTTDKAGMLHILEGSDTKAIVGNGKASLGFWCRIPTASSMNKVRGAILEWTGATEDLADATAVATWNGGDSAPTFSAGWAAKGQVDFTTKGSWTFVKSENVTLAAGVKNLAVFIWIEDDTYVTNNHVFITGVTLEPGALAVAAIPRMHGEEAMLCRRRFWTSYDHGVGPGTAPALPGAIYAAMTRATTVNVGASQLYFRARFPMPMMKTPTVAIFAPTSGVVGNCEDGVPTDRAAVEVVVATGTGGCVFDVTGDPVNDILVRAHITASAEPSV